ncbi:MAG: hypothetical protein B6U85_01880 [Desulfurococcales archaeon ex4484_42]|nr:MAG: hypothetical protein B6U85_01880 [Desulfurococcales archaeon ex4484_42]
MTHYLLLSYPLSKETTHVPRSLGPIRIWPRSRMIKPPEGIGSVYTRWDSYNNTSIIELTSHTGTHIDLPFHIDPQGYTLSEYTIDDFIFQQPILINIPKNDYEEITRKDLEPYRDQLGKADLLLIYTGFSKYRFTDPARYEERSPGFSVDGAKFIVEEFPNIRAVGVDLLGIENIGKARPEFPVHKVFLRRGRKFFHIEDMNLEPAVGKKLLKVIVAPLWIPNIDGVPVTVIAEVEG